MINSVDYDQYIEANGEKAGDNRITGSIDGIVNRYDNFIGGIGKKADTVK